MATSENRPCPNLRVDNDPDPITEITRLAEASGAFDDLGGIMFAEPLMVGDDKDVSEEESESAPDALEGARQVLGDDLGSPSWKAVLLGRAGGDIAAAASFEEVLDRGPHRQPHLDSVAAAVLVSRATVADLVSS